MFHKAKESYWIGLLGRWPQARVLLTGPLGHSTNPIQTILFFVLEIIRSKAPGTIKANISLYKGENKKGTLPYNIKRSLACPALHWLAQHLKKAWTKLKCHVKTH